MANRVNLDIKCDSKEEAVEIKKRIEKSYDPVFHMSILEPLYSYDGEPVINYYSVTVRTYSKTKKEIIKDLDLVKAGGRISPYKVNKES